MDPEEQEKLIDAMIEVEFEEGDILPRRVTGDRVTYILLDGCVAFEDGRMLGASGMLHGESMVDLALRSPMPTATETSRALRLRLDDFNEIVARDSPMGAKLYFRLARHLCRKTQA